MTNQGNLGAAADGVALHWINGQWRDSVEHADSFDPATGTMIGRYAVGGVDEAREAVAAASRAFEESDWKGNRERRTRVLNELAERFEAHAEDLAGATEPGERQGRP